MAEIHPWPKQNERIDLGQPWVATRVSDILELPPPPQWIWDNRIRRGTVTLVGGETKIGKTLLLQQLLSCCAVGVPCLGRHTERARGFAWFCEDPNDEVIRRQFAINEACGIDMKDYDDRYYWHTPIGDCCLAEFDYGKLKKEQPGWDRFWREIDEQESELIVIDTARAVFGGQEKEPNQVTPFMRKLQQKAIEGNRAIILAIHPPDANIRKGYAGSVAWLASARAGLSLERPVDYDPMTDTPNLQRVLRGIGANYSNGRAVAKLKFDPDLNVFVADEPDDPPPPRVASQTAANRDVFDNQLDGVLRLARNNGGHLPADVMHPLSAPNRYRKVFDKRTSSNDLYAAQERLLANRRWVRVRVGGRCLLRPADGAKYEDETPWSI